MVTERAHEFRRYPWNEYVAIQTSYLLKKYTNSSFWRCIAGPQDQDLLQKIASNEMFMNLLSDPRVEAVLEKLSAKYQEITNPAEGKRTLLFIRKFYM